MAASYLTWVYLAAMGCLPVGRIQSAAELTSHSMVKFCDLRLDMSTSNVHSFQLKLGKSFSYKRKTCEMRIRANPGKRLLFQFKRLSISGGSLGSCSKDYLEIYNEDAYTGSLTSKISGPICGYYGPKDLTSESNEVSLRFVYKAKSEYSYAGFTALVTDFHEGTCSSDEFQCSNKRCINSELRCNNYDNCGDYSDLSYSTCDDSGSIHWAPFIIMPIVFVVIMLIVCCICCMRCRANARKSVSTVTYVTPQFQPPHQQPRDIPLETYPLSACPSAPESTSLQPSEYAPPPSYSQVMANQESQRSLFTNPWKNSHLNN